MPKLLELQGKLSEKERKCHQNMGGISPSIGVVEESATPKRLTGPRPLDLWELLFYMFDMVPPAKGQPNL